MYLGINAFHHDASASLIDQDGKIIAAVEEERFSRNKRESRFPVESIKFCLKEAGITINELDGIAFSWSPFLYLTQRILWSDLLYNRVTFKSLLLDIKTLFEMLRVNKYLKSNFNLDTSKIKTKYFRHHLCHAASAYYASGYDDCAFLTMDGQGELESMTWGVCSNGKIIKFGQNYSPNSIGKVYSAISRMLGFLGSEKEGTVMALAAFGKPVFLDLLNKIINLDKNTEDLKLIVDRSYFDFYTNANEVKFSKKLLGVLNIKQRITGDALHEVHINIASSLQKHIEQIILESLERLFKLTKNKKIVLSGGVALNSVLNGKIETLTSFKDVFIQPAANDAGLALGAAYLLKYNNRDNLYKTQQFDSAALGPEFNEDDYSAALHEYNLPYSRLESENLVKVIANELSNGKVVAWFQGRMEFGPRALGNRSILGDPRNPEMLNLLNKVKHREYFRPFAISVLEESASEIFESVTESPFMLKVDKLRESWKNKLPSAQHIDGSVRIQTLKSSIDGIYYDLVKNFYIITETPLIINTSFNVKGDPIVCTPKEAIDTFLKSEIDILVLGNYVVYKYVNLVLQPEF